MKHGLVFYTCRTEFDENAIRLMFKTEYFTYEKKLLLMRVAFAAVLLAVGMLTRLPIGVRILCMLLFEPLCNLYEIPAGVLRDSGHALYPALSTMVGTCAFRIAWIYTVFRAKPTLPCSTMRFLFHGQRRLC